MPKNNDVKSASPRSSSIIFGSCNSQYYEQPFWNVIKSRNPTAFVWGGDAVYSDDRLVGQEEEEASMVTSTETNTDDSSNFHQKEDIRSRWWSSLFEFYIPRRKSKSKHATPEYLRQLYEEQLQVPDYRDLLREDNGVGGKLSIFGTIDDHDYGINNGDKTFIFRRENGIEYTKFLGLDEESAMSKRAAKGLGVYGVQVYDFSSKRDPSRRLLSDEEAGLDPDVVEDATSNISSEKNQLVAIFVLDVRTNRTPWVKKFPDRFSLDPEGDFLGEEQWEWFETAIGRSEASVNIVVNGLQAHAPWFYDASLIENWSGFPKAQHRLYQTILQPNVRAPILVTGDVHLSQFLRKDCRRNVVASDDGKPTNDQIIRPLYEVTTSGMTHSWGSKSSYCGRPNRSRLCTFYPSKVTAEIIMTYAHWASPWTALLLGDGRSKTRQFSLDRNIAEIDFDWDQSLVIVRILGVEGQTLLRQDWSMDRLTGTVEDTLLSHKSFELGQRRLESALQYTLPKDHDEYICVNYRGNPDKLHFAFSVTSTICISIILGIYPILFFYGILTKLVFRRQRNIKPQKRRGKTTLHRLKND